MTKIGLSEGKGGMCAVWDRLAVQSFSMHVHTFQKMAVEGRQEDEFLSSCKGPPWDVKPRRREAAAAVNDGVGEGAAFPQRSLLEEERPKVVPRIFTSLTEIKRYWAPNKDDSGCQNKAIGPIPMPADTASSVCGVKTRQLSDTRKMMRMLAQRSAPRELHRVSVRW